LARTAVAPLPAPPPEPTRGPHEFSTRNCVLCGGDLPGDKITCPKCGKQSVVALCDHTVGVHAWRTTRWNRSDGNHGRRSKDVVAVTVGDVTVFLGRFRDALSLRTEDGARLPLRRVRAVEPGAEIVERMTHVGQCYRCRLAFFLADCEILASGPPRILRVPVDAPTRQYMRPVPDPVRISAAYLALGQRDEDGP
jgi:hypothetical protein